MTLLEVYDVLRRDNEDPLVVLTGFLQLARSCIQKRTATAEEVEASVIIFAKKYGPVTKESVEKFVTELGPEFLNIDILNDLIMAFMSED